MTETLNFTDVVAPVPDLDALAERIAGLAAALRAAAGLDECVEVVRD